MKKNHRFLALALVLCGINAGANAQTFTSNGINYEVTSTSPNKVKVADNSDYSGAAVIPSSVEYNSATYAVTAIGEWAFGNCSGLTSVTIGNSVTAIGNYAFYDCNGLTGTLTIPNSVTAIGNSAFSHCSGLASVTIPNSVTAIGERAFEWCSKLTSVTIGNSVETIGERAFQGCIGLTGIDVATGNLHYSSLDGVVFNKVHDTLILFSGGKTGSYIIPESVKTIGSSAFLFCIGLTSVTIGNSVEMIGELLLPVASA